MPHAGTYQFIAYTPCDENNERKINDIPAIVGMHGRTGTVNMKDYMDWLRQHGYSFAE